MIQLLELRIGQTRTYQSAHGAPWTSAIDKQPSNHGLALTRTGFQGDEVANPDVHGGPDQAVLAYASEHYPLWNAEGVKANPGDFGENLLLHGLTDQEACIGDCYALGETILQVSHPRQPCSTLIKRFGRKDILPLIWSLGRGGWYLRVIQEGWVEPGLTMRLLERINPGCTVARVLTAFDRAVKHPGEAMAMAELSGLTEMWSRKLMIRAKHKDGALTVPQQ